MRRGQASGGDLQWRLVVDDGPTPGSRNMALDHALAECLEDGQGVLRLYGWSPPTISFGRNEPSRGLFDVQAAARQGIAFVRRPTGGRAVLHAQEVTYAAAFPLRALGGLREAYLSINRGLVEGLKELGVAAQVEESGEILAPDAGPCFQSPAPGEVTAAGRKLVGSAQVRLGHAVLQHGSVILRGDQSAVSRLSGGREEAPPPASVDALAGRLVAEEEVRAALAGGLRLALGGSWAEGGYQSWEIEAADRLEAARYATNEWTWRR